MGVGGTRAAAIWDVNAGAFALRSEPVIRPYSDYAGQAPGEDPFNAVDPAPAIGHPLGYDVAAAPGYKPVDHIDAALHHLQVGVPPVTPHDALGPLLVPDNPSKPASRTQVKAMAAQQRHTASGLPPCISLAEASLAYPVSKEKTSATGIPQKYLSKWLIALSPKDSLYACTFEGCDHIFKQLASVYNHLCRLHLGVVVGCYYCSGRWWTSKGWSDHHAGSIHFPTPISLAPIWNHSWWRRHKPVSLQSLRLFPPLLWLMTSPKTSFYPPLPLRRIKRTVLSLLLLPFHKKVLTSAATTEVAASSLGNFRGARPRVSTSAAGSGCHKKALPHHSTCV